MRCTAIKKEDQQSSPGGLEKVMVTSTGSFAKRGCWYDCTASSFLWLPVVFISKEKPSRPWQSPLELCDRHGASPWGWMAARGGLGSPPHDQGSGLSAEKQKELSFLSSQVQMSCPARKQMLRSYRQTHTKWDTPQKAALNRDFVSSGCLIPVKSYLQVPGLPGKSCCLTREEDI